MRLWERSRRVRKWTKWTEAGALERRCMNRDMYDRGWKGS
jgi:hypothetical protein